MIELKQEEINAFNILSQRAQQVQTELNETLKAQRAFVELLEIKYNAIYDEKTGNLIEKEG